MASQQEMFAAMMQTMAPMFAQYLKDNSAAALLTPKKEPPAHLPKKRRSPKSRSPKKGSRNKKTPTPKKKRKSPPKSIKDDRARLAEVLLPLVDQHIRVECKKKLFFMHDDETGKNWFDEQQFEPYVNTAVRLALGLVGPERLMQAFTLCKSIVKNRHTYVTKDPKRQIKTFATVGERETALTELRRQMLECAKATDKEGGEAKVSDGETSSDETESSGDGADKIKVDDLFESEPEEPAAAHSPMVEELATLNFDQTPAADNGGKFFPCVAVGCEKVLTAEECFPVMHESRHGRCDVVSRALGSTPATAQGVRNVQGQKKKNDQSGIKGEGGGARQKKCQDCDCCC